jgi:hypothetical protein
MKNFLKFLKFQIFAVAVTTLVAVSVLTPLSRAGAIASPHLKKTLGEANDSHRFSQVKNLPNILAYDGSEWLFAVHHSQRSAQTNAQRNGKVHRLSTSIHRS